jgi:hypothetical protein
VQKRRVLAMQCGAVDRAAQLKELSQFPGEYEYLWTPMCYIEAEPEDKQELEMTDDGLVKVLPVRVNTNLKSQTGLVLSTGFLFSSFYSLVSFSPGCTSIYSKFSHIQHHTAETQLFAGRVLVEGPHRVWAEHDEQQALKVATDYLGDASAIRWQQVLSLLALLTNLWTPMCYIKARSAAHS